MSSSHKRNTMPMLVSARCGARTRAGGSCRSPAVKGKWRCRMHGGAKGSGAPQGNRNAFKHGTYTKAAFAIRAWVRQVGRAKLVKEIEQASGVIESTMESLPREPTKKTERQMQTTSHANSRAKEGSPQCDPRS